MILLFIIFLIFWIFLLFNSYRSIHSIKKLKNFSTIHNHNCKISIIIAVRDGEKEIENTIKAILSSDYSNIELIVVNDRSVDKTFEIIEKIKIQNNKLQTIHLSELPLGWLGKVHALKCGSEISTGDYLLFMDADIEINSKVLNQALTICKNFQLDHLGIVPHFVKGDFLLNMSLSNATILFCTSNRPWLNIEERSFEFVRGVGAFNLVRNDFFKKTEGFEWLKMDVADDVALSMLIAKNQGRSMLSFASEEGPSVEFYDSFWSMVKGFEKNSYGGLANYRFTIALIFFFLSWLVILFPLMALISFHNTVLFSLGLCFLGLNLIFAVAINKQIKSPILEVFLIPFGLFIQGMVLMRAALLCHYNNGIIWRGTHYQLDDLRRGCRVKIKF